MTSAQDAIPNGNTSSPDVGVAALQEEPATPATATLSVESPQQPDKKSRGNWFSTLIVIVLVAGGGYWLGQHKAMDHVMSLTNTTIANSPDKGRKLLYYRNPMGLADTSPTPKKDPMGMDYIPVYADEQTDAPTATPQIKISTDKVQKLGVRTTAAKLRALVRIIHATGRVATDERRMFVIAPKFEGYVEHLYVNITGEEVAKGQPLFTVYSPELVSAQREYAIAAQGVMALKGADNTARAGMQQLAESSLARLKNWDISADQLTSLTHLATTNHTLLFRSPVQGIVTEKKAIQGMRFMPGETLYQVADLSNIWVLADVFEQDSGLVRSGAKATITIDAYPGKIFNGTITYVYPTLQAQTRTVPVRIELANPKTLLKPGMFAQVNLNIKSKATVTTVPISAVIDSGTRQIVLIQADKGRYAPREVKLGASNDTYVEIIDGIKDGELVVTSANFLIDAESNLQAAISGFGHAANASVASAPSTVIKTPSVANAVSVHVGHQAQGKIDEIDAASGTISISHDPIASLKWPAMTMEFNVVNRVMLKGLKPGAAVAFEFIERKPGEWVITHITPHTYSH